MAPRFLSSLWQQKKASRYDCLTSAIITRLRKLCKNEKKKYVEMILTLVSALECSEEFRDEISDSFRLTWALALFSLQLVEQIQIDLHLASC